MTICSRAALLAASAALCLGSIAAPAATASCWTRADVAAAKVREMQTKLMVAVLQCQVSGVDILASYNRFLRNGRSALRSANERLKTHFMAERKIVGQREYDRYTTALANAYGGGQISLGSCAETSALLTEAAMAKSDLLLLAAREVIVPTLPSAPCPANNAVVLAAK
jgi:hypothetical protein